MAKCYMECNQISKLIERYVEAGGDVLTVEEGSLGYGFTILYGAGLKTFIIKEQYLNEWSSTHTVRGYNKTPKKYQEIVDELL